MPTRPSFICVAASLLFFVGTPAFSADIPPSQAKGYHLVFSDDFNRLDLDASKSGDHTWHEGIWFYRNHAPLENFRASDAAITTTWRRGQAGNDSSITTFSANPKGRRAWRYGYFEARLKWTPVIGAWPALWLIPIQPALDPSVHETGEIDIFEGQGDEPRSFFGTIHYWQDSKDLRNSGKTNRFDLSFSNKFDQYHEYGLLWEPNRITWFYDNVPLHSEPTYDVFNTQDYFLVMGMQEGPGWKEGDLTGVTADKLQLTVDWVRVWQK